MTTTTTTTATTTTTFHIRTSPEVRVRLPALREELSAAGFDAQNLAKAAFADDLPRAGTLASEVPVAIDDETPLTEVPAKLRNLLRLFHLNEPLERSEMENALSASAIGALVMSGLVETEGSTFRSNVFLTAWHDLLLVSDRMDVVGNDDPLSIFPPGPSTAAVAFYLPRHARPTRAVDVGTGGGALALFMARLYGPGAKVIAIDPNRRAIDACTFNSALNGISTVEAYVADHEEIIDRRQELAKSVDLFAWNMPLAWAPDKFALSYDGERLMAQVYEALPRLLSANGHAVLRHDAQLPGDWFENWVRSHGGLPGFQALLRRESETARDHRPFEQEEDADMPYRLCISLVAPRQEGGRPAAVLDFDSWGDALRRKDKADWQAEIRRVSGWSTYALV